MEKVHWCPEGVGACAKVTASMAALACSSAFAGQKLTYLPTQGEPDFDV